MFGYDEFSINLAYDKFFLILILIALGIYSVYVYRITIPPITKFKKIFLSSLRTAALFILILVLFEPILNLTKKTSVEPKHFIFIDNSRSMLIDDGTEKPLTVRNIVSDLLSSGTQNFAYHLFGNQPRLAETQSLNDIKFEDGNTNLASVFTFSEETEENIASLTLISDGVFTDGSNPIYSALKLKVPVFTIGVGDTTQRNDVELRKVQYNEIIYSETPASISETVLNNGFGGKQVRIELLENSVVKDQKIVTLSNDGIQNELFSYIPKTSGEKKLQLRISGLEGEFTYANNLKVFYVNVLSNKIKVTLLAGSPSSDLSFIKNSLMKDKNLSVKTVTQISSNRFLENNYRNSIDSADVFFLVGFPANNTSAEIMDLVRQKIVDGKKPFFISLSPGFNWNNLSAIQSELPIIFRGNLPGKRDVQPEILPSQSNNPILHHNSQNLVQNWNSLPPVQQDKIQYQVKAESKTIANIKVNNTIFNEPLIVSRNFSGKRSIAVLGYDLWKWKLQAALKQNDLFDNFVINSLKWLHINESQKQVNIKTNKKNFSVGETVEFTAQVYDESFNPVSDAQVKVKIRSEKNNYEVELSSIGNGLYEGTMNYTEAGDFYFEGESFQNGNLLGTDKGSFNFGELDVEMINPRMNYELLMQIAEQTSGKYFSKADYQNLFRELNRLTEISAKEKIINSEISLWSNEWMLIIPILLFAIEWFIRKREGML
jgi:hypothetical protein